MAANRKGRLPSVSAGEDALAVSKERETQQENEEILGSILERGHYGAPGVLIRCS